MSTDLLPVLKNLLEGNEVTKLDRGQRKALAKQLGQMQSIADAADVGMDEISAMHSYSEYKVATTLAAAQVIKGTVAASGNLTEEYKESSQQRTQLYLSHMEVLVDQASAEIVKQVVNGRKR